MRLFATASLIALCGCATIESEEGQIELSDASNAKHEAVTFETVSGLSPYKAGGKSAQVEWFGCKRSDPKGLFLLVTRETGEFGSAGFCRGWIAQAFLSAGYEVVAVNRPGYGKTTPNQKDFSGPNSVAAVEAAAHAVEKQPGLGPVFGLWAYDSGVIAAGFAARKIAGAKSLILGGGIYDAESFLNSGSGPLKNELAQIAAKEPGSKTFESRSLSWDVSDLPKNVFLYHVKDEKEVPSQQSKLFSDTLSSQEFKVKTQFIDGTSHEIPEAVHRTLLEGILKAL